MGIVAESKYFGLGHTVTHVPVDFSPFPGTRDFSGLLTSPSAKVI
jgi:hypothetical protein